MNCEEMLKAAKPILFNTEMVRAIFNGRKTVIRRPVKTKKFDVNSYGFENMETDPYETRIDRNGSEYPYPLKGLYANFSDGEYFPIVKAPYNIGDYLYVRETWGISNFDIDEQSVCIVYKAGDVRENWQEVVLPKDKFEHLYYNYSESEPDWHPSIYMPKEAARIFLRVTDVRVERLQDITEKDAYEEGVDVEIPPICRQNSPTEEQQRKYNNMTAKQKEQYINELAKHTYMGWCVYADRLNIAFRKLWNSTVKKSDLAKYSWNANPWVWVIEFENIKEKAR